jgi:sterol desaturase/sphingolipid hydroxylase (fatty acid hydroxylase superfamily)
MAVELPAWVLAAALTGSLLGFSYLEERKPLRRRVEPRGRHFARNAAVAVLGYSTVGLVQVLIFAAFADWVSRRGYGFLHLVRWPDWLTLIAGVLLLDWTLWIWHLLNHRVPLLWRFHAVHHVDLDLDASTGLRFHFGELALSIGMRALQLVLIGPTPLAVGVWQALLAASIFFHHSNTRLPIVLEGLLVRFVATPRMHGIHHSTVREERDANFASLFTLWDRLHGTLRLNVPQDEVEIGVPGFADRSRLSLGKILVQPFRRQPALESLRVRVPPVPGPKGRMAK